LDDPNFALQKMLLCDLGALEAPEGASPLLRPLRGVRATRRTARTLGVRCAAQGRATARGRDQHTARGERAPRSRIALERERGTVMYARKNIFFPAKSNPSVFTKQLEAVTDLT
jgi:hypothetical protein